MSSHILTECLGISDVLDAEHEPQRYDYLITWSNEQTNEETRASMYNRLLKAVHLGLSESSDWFDFLIPLECKNHHCSNEEIPNACTNTDCSCSLAVTEQELSKICHKMPPRMWKHVCRVCLGISDADLFKAEYKNFFRSIELSAFDALLTWSQAQEGGVTKARLYGKFVKARNLGLCESTEWFDLLLPIECQNHLQMSKTKIVRTPLRRLTFLQECFVRLLHNPLHLHIMLTSFLVKLLYTKILMSCATVFSFVTLLWIWFSAIAVFFGIIFHYRGRCCVSVKHTQTLKSVLGTTQKCNFFFFLSSVLQFVLIFMSHGKIVESIKGYDGCAFLSLSYGIVIVMVQIPLLLKLTVSESISNFKFIPLHQITVVYGQYKPLRLGHEILLSYITWSVTGMILAYVIRSTLNPIWISYTSCFTAIGIIVVWACTLDHDSISSIKCSWTGDSDGPTDTKASCCKAFYTIGFNSFHMLFSCILFFFHSQSEKLWGHITFDDSELIMACISTLVILNMQRIFGLYTEDRRRPRWELFVFILLCVLNAYMVISNPSKSTFTRWFFYCSKLFFPMSGFAPIDFNAGVYYYHTSTTMNMTNTITASNVTANMTFYDTYNATTIYE